jgi:3-hydroxymyristoyl/3-hydroxydecanoyl-(acyl carrier protein) dehydratase
MASDDGGGATTVVPRTRLEALCAGHFPGDPIVPGAYVAGLLADVSARALGGGAGRPALVEVERCTFLAPLRPDGDATLIASPPERGPSGIVVVAEVHMGEQCVARGRFRFA